MTKPFEETQVGRSFKYEIGPRRYDGKYNVWVLIEAFPNRWTWVVAFVADTWPTAKRWIEYVEAKGVKAA